MIHPTAIVDVTSTIGNGTKIWHFTHVRENSHIGKACTIGKGCYIDANVHIGDNVKIQNGVSIYQGVSIENNVFIGPNATFTNDKHPRALGAWHLEKTMVRQGASIGANATIICGTEIGEGSMVGAGAVVTKNVKAHDTVVGNPARSISPWPKKNNIESTVLKMGLIGLGKMGNYHLKAILESPEVRLVGFYDPAGKRELSPDIAINQYNSVQSLLADSDAVIVASPSEIHYVQVKEALNNNTHVLCEKPLTLCSQKTNELIALAESKNLILQPGQIERYNPAYYALVDNIHGDDKALSMEFCRMSKYDKKNVKTSIVYDLLVHDIDLLVSLLGERLTLLSAWGIKVLSPTTDIVRAVLRSERGVNITIMASRISECCKREFRAHLLHKYIEGDLLNKTIKLYAPNHTDDTTHKYKIIEQSHALKLSGQDQLRAQLTCFINAINRNESQIKYSQITHIANLLDEINSIIGEEG